MGQTHPGLRALTSARLTATLVNQLEQWDKRCGLISICMGYGMGIAALFDRQVH